MKLLIPKNVFISKLSFKITFNPILEFKIVNFQETVCIERLAYDQSGAAVEFSRSWIDTNIARYTTRIS